MSELNDLPYSEGYWTKFQFKMYVFLVTPSAFCMQSNTPIDLPSFLYEVLRSMLKTLQMELRCNFVHIHRHLRTLNYNYGRIWSDLVLSTHKLVLQLRDVSMTQIFGQTTAAGYKRHSFVAVCGRRRTNILNIIYVLFYFALEFNTQFCAFCRFFNSIRIKLKIRLFQLAYHL